MKARTARRLLALFTAVRWIGRTFRSSMQLTNDGRAGVALGSFFAAFLGALGAVAWNKATVNSADVRLADIGHWFLLATIPLQIYTVVVLVRFQTRCFVKADELIEAKLAADAAKPEPLPEDVLQTDTQRGHLTVVEKQKEKF